MEVAKNKVSYPIVLAVAGSDSGAGAGIQADIKTCSALQTYAMTAITAITAQNTCGVDSYMPIPSNFLEAQIKCACSDIFPDAVKIGMLPDIDSINTLSKCITEIKLRKIVLDPVCVSTSGHTLNTPECCRAMAKSLFPKCDVVTPNIPELELLTGIVINSIDDVQTAAQKLIYETNVSAVMAKCGHLQGLERGNLLITNAGEKHFFHSQYVNTINTHGTGCTLSSGIAAQLAKGQSLVEACATATKWLNRALSAGANIMHGKGHGPVHHFHEYFNPTFEIKP